MLFNRNHLIHEQIIICKKSYKKNILNLLDKLINFNQQMEQLCIREMRTPEPEREKQRYTLTPIRKIRNDFLSELVNKSFEESDSDKSIASNKSTCSSGFMCNCSFQYTQTINIRLFYYINENKKEIEIIINEDKTIKDMILFSINLINEQLISDKENIKLDVCNLSNYCIKMIENEEELKNIENIPALDSDSFIANFNLDNHFFLLWTDKRKSNLLPYIRDITHKEKNIQEIIKKHINSFKNTLQDDKIIKEDNIGKSKLNEINTKNNNLIIS